MGRGGPRGSQAGAGPADSRLPWRFYCTIRSQRGLAHCLFPEGAGAGGGLTVAFPDSAGGRQNGGRIVSGRRGSGMATLDKQAEDKEAAITCRPTAVDGIRIVNCAAAACPPPSGQRRPIGVAGCGDQQAPGTVPSDYPNRN